MASTSNQIDSSSSSSSSSSSTPCWNVFLSFRGKDTRKSFTGHLYSALDRAGIQTFMDDPELPRGEEISLQLLKAIEESKVSIVVFSKNYASSRWCLDELVKILECKRTKGHLVLPVFYNVDPSVVRHKTGSFAEAFESHKERFGNNMEIVEKWEGALTDAANLSGYDLENDANGHEATLIQKIVQKVLLEVNLVCLHIAKQPVGIESRVEYVTPLLSIGTNDIRRIGIYGMGGIGKTTIAKALFNNNFQYFEGSCFLSNVREASEERNDCSRLAEIQGLENLNSIEVINLEGCNNLSISFKETFLQVYSDFGRQIDIYLPTKDFPDWFGHQILGPNLSTICFDVPQNSENKFLGMILWVVSSESIYLGSYARVENKTNGNTWHKAVHYRARSWVSFIPKTKIALKFGDKIEASISGNYFIMERFGVHCVYKTDTIEN